MRIRSAQVLKQRHIGIFRCRVGYREGNTQNRVGAQFALVRGTVQTHHNVVNPALIAGILTDQFGGDIVNNCLHGILYAFTLVATLVAVTAFYRFKSTGGSPRGNRGAARGARIQ